MSSVSGADLIKLATSPLFELLLKAGIDAVEKRWQKPVDAMTREEIAADLAALELSIRPWDSDGDDTGDAGALG